MKEDLIEALEKADKTMVEVAMDEYLNEETLPKIAKVRGLINKALQKAKEEQPKDVEEFNEKIDYLFSKINWGKSHLDAKAVQIMNSIKTDFANSRKEVTDEEIDFISGKKARENLEKYADQKKYILGFKHCAKWMREQLNK